LRIFAAVIRANIADRAGNVFVYGDEFADDLLAQAPRHVSVTAEKVVDEPPAELRDRVREPALGGLPITFLVEPGSGSWPPGPV